MARGTPIKEILKELSAHFVRTRQAGHTTAMLEGAKHATTPAGRVMILASTADHAASIRKDLRNNPGVKVNAMCYAAIERGLHGHSEPLLIDHAAVHSICDLAVGTIEDLESQLADEKRKNARLHDYLVRIERFAQEAKD